MENIEHPTKTNKLSIFRRYKQFILATLLYFLAHVFDYILTLNGLTKTNGEEANLFAQRYMEFFGLHIGLLIFKMQMFCIVVLAALGLEHIYRKKKSRIKSEYILTIGAILTFLGGSLWFLLLFKVY
ncbi:MAG: DUF5658 family protein [Candidatus Poribacteria bacterium]